jgi:hypothetical protein
MTDKLDRMLQALPKANPSPELAARIQRTIHRRHRRRQVTRWGSALALAMLGLWLVWPGVLWLSSGELYASGAPWLLGTVDYLSAESLDMVNGLLNGTLSAQNAVGSTFAFSTWIGALFLCCAIFLAIDARTWQPNAHAGSHRGRSTMLPASLHI